MLAAHQTRLASLLDERSQELAAHVVDDQTVAIVAEDARIEALLDGRPPSAYIRSKTVDSFASVASASVLIDRSGCICGTRVSGDISINIDDCFLSSPRIVCRKISSMRQKSIPGRAFSAAC